ncbi:MAG: PQQ-binding-like beta-propeller repeat protein [Acidobacteriota bacterium]|nr:PQQ-binding-like beta-propeller repeat protein [Acidobacteriota bacterium]MDQ3417739.1 PQQ-binding-like beta-propeller repeat protein [Acidobacteriota bacterium]
MLSVVLLADADVSARQAVTPQSGAEGILGVPEVLPGTALPPPEAPPDILWTVPIAAAPVTSPIMAGEHVLISHLPGVIAAHRVSSGERIWQKGLVPDQRLVADATMLFVASGEAIHALRLTDGAVAWRAPAGTLTAPLLVQGGWVIAATATRLMALRAADGTAVWTIDVPTQRQGAAISGEMLFVPSDDGYIRARDLKSGNAIWQHRLGGQPGEPLVVGESLVVSGTDKALYKLSAATGEENWRYRVGASIRGPAASDGERVFVTALDNMIRALDLGNGSLKWQIGLPFRPLTGPVVAGGTVFITSPGTDIKMLRTLNGTQAGTVAFPAKLAITPGMQASEYGVAIVAITGGLEESWHLLITRPVRALPATAPPPKK